MVVQVFIYQSSRIPRSGWTQYGNNLDDTTFSKTNLVKNISKIKNSVAWTSP